MLSHLSQSLIYPLPDQPCQFASTLAQAHELNFHKPQDKCGGTALHLAAIGG